MCSIKQLFVEFFFHFKLLMWPIKKNRIIRIFCISGWLFVPINPDKWSPTVLMKVTN